MADSPLSIIKSYLVSLGFQVDKSSYDSATQAIDSVRTGLSAFAGDTVRQFGIAGTAVTSFVAAAVVGMSRFLNDLGNAQIQYEMLARQMWTTQQNAEAFSTTLKAMGTTLQDLYLSPTLMAQFQALHNQTFQMMPPAEFQQQMQFIQSISYEFKRMKLEGTYALQWIGYYFIKYMAGPITTIKTTLSNINNIIIKTMPYWTKVVAEVMSWFAQFGVTTVEAIKAVAQEFMNIGQSIPNNIKLIGLALLGLLIIMNQGPIGWIIDGFVALGLAVNDFLTYIHGGQSEFGPFWQKLIDLYNKLKESGAIDAFKNAFKTALKDISIGLQDVWNLLVIGWQKLGDFYNYLQSSGAIDKFKSAMVVAFNDISAAIKDTIKGIVNLYTTMQNNGTINNFEKTFSNVFDFIQSTVIGIIGWFQQMWKSLNQTGILKNLLDDFGNLLLAVLNLVSAVGKFLSAVIFFKSAIPSVSGLGNALTNFILSALQTIDTVIKQVTSGLNAIADFFTGKWGDMAKNLGDIFTKDIPSMPQSYIYPSSNSQTSNSSNVKVNVNQNIYGSSDPKATGSAATNSLTTTLRSYQGVIV